MKLLVTIPAYNEEKILEKNIIKLNHFLKKNIKEDYLIEIADNRSKDKTKQIAQKLSKRFKNINYIFVDKQGKWRAIKESWKLTGKKYDILSFMDADLATDLKYFPKLIKAITKEDYDIAIGSRYNKKSIVDRSIFREFIGRGYILLQKILFRATYEDTQCGFKAIKKDKYNKIEPLFKKEKLKQDKTDMFTDTELLLIANRIFNYKIKSIPVKWIEAEKSETPIIRTSLLFLVYLFRMFKYINFLEREFKNKKKKRNNKV